MRTKQTRADNPQPTNIVPMTTSTRSPSEVQAPAGMQRQELTFIPRELIQATLPHRDPGEVALWTRKNGNYRLTIQPGNSDGKLLGYPFGVIPRLLMFWLTREVLRVKTRRVALGESLAEFMRKVGLNPANGTGKRSDSRRLRDQIERLFRARISFEYT